MRFCTIHQPGWKPIDPAWMRHVQRSARFVWLRFIGLNERTARNPQVFRSPLIKKWENAAIQYSIRYCGGRSAFLWVTFRINRPIKNYTPPRLGEAIDSSDACRQRWRQAGAKIPDRIHEMFGMLRQQMPWRLGIFAEDFSCRWVMDSGVRPDIMVLDTPMISAAEAASTGLLNRGEVHVRSSVWPPLAFYDDWKLPFDIGELLVGEPTTLRHGTW